MGRGKIKIFQIIVVLLFLLYMMINTVYGIREFDSTSPMYRVLECGNYNEVKLHLDIYPQDINAADIYTYNTPLHYGVFYGDPKVIKLLISRGAKINARNISGETPLHIALESDKLKISEILIDSGADVNIRDGKGRTPIFHPVKKGDFNTVKLLVKAGADINIIDDNDKPLIKYAFDRGNRKIIKLLISKGADPEYTQIFDCLKKGDFDMISYMAVKSPGFFKLAIIPFLLPILLIITILIIRRIRSK